MMPTVDKYYDAPKNVFLKLFDEAYNYAYGRQWVTFHYHTFINELEMIREMADQTRCKVTVPAFEGNYYSDDHVYLKFSVRLTWFERFERLYMWLPYRLRRPIKTVVRRIARLNIFKKQFFS